MVTLSLSGSSFELGNGKDTCLYIPVLPISSEAKSKLTVHVKATNGDTKYTFHGISSAEDGVYINQGEMGSIPVTITTGTAAAFWGQGTKTCPFLIENEDDLKQLRTLVNGASSGGLDPYNTSARFYKQTGNITLTETTWGASGNEAIGKPTPTYQSFCANYDGGGYWVNLNITGLESSTNSCIGLFGAVGGGGSIKNLTVNGNINTVDANLSVGGIAGRVTGVFTFGKCRNEIALTTYSSATTQNCGGICGEIASGSGNAVKIEECKNAANITCGTGSFSNLGGVCGNITSGDVTFEKDTNAAASTVSGEITGYTYYGFGGICGACSTANNTVTMNYCVNEGKISTSGSATRTGGLLGNAVGSTKIKIDHCINDSIQENSVTVNTVSGQKNVGGILGYNAVNATEITNCENWGMINGSGENVAGIIGYAYESVSISFCNNIGSVNSSSYSVGGMVGSSNTNSSTFYQCKNRAHITGLYSVGGILGFGKASKMTRCINWGVISATGSSSGKGLAGLLGTLDISSVIIIDSCKNNGEISCKISNEKNYLAGLIGYAGSAISVKNSGNSGAITATKCWAVAGLVGQFRSDPSDSTGFYNCYNTAIINTNSYSSGYKAGFATSYNKSISAMHNCYSGTSFAKGNARYYSDLFASNSYSYKVVSNVSTFTPNTLNSSTSVSNHNNGSAISTISTTSPFTVSGGSTSLKDALNNWQSSNQKFSTWEQSDEQLPHLSWEDKSWAK